MMVTSCDDSTPNGGSILPVLAKLKNEEVPFDERVDLYSSLAEEFQKDDITSLLHDFGQQGSALVCHFCRDIQSDQKDLNQASLRILGLCLHYEEVARYFTDSDSSAILTGLCSTILKTEDKSTCTRALWCLSRQQLPCSVIQSELHNILCALEHVLQQNKFQSMTSEYEAVNLLIRLLGQLPDVMNCHTKRWAPLLFPLIVHSAHKIREKAYQSIQLAMSSLRKHQSELAPSLVMSLKSTMLVDMAELFANKHERYVLRVWKLCVDLLGKALHKGGSLINLMLRIVEQGFKHGYSEIKRDSFEAWKVLIDNFALDLDVLSNAKRLKLLMQPFLATSTKQESVALAKFDVWWYLCTALSSRLSSNFEMVVVPLLNFSLGLIKPADSTPSSTHRHMQSMHSGLKALAMSSPATTPRMNLSSPFRSCDQYDSLVMQGVIILSKMLTSQDVSVGCERLHNRDSLPALTIPVLSKVAMVFIKITSHLIPIVCNTIQQHGKLIDDEMCIEIFGALTLHVTNALENSKKQDNAEMFGSFLYHLQTLIRDVDMEPTTILKFMSSLKSLPLKVLSSSAYLSGSVGCVLHGTPTLFLLELLFGPKLIKSSTEERYFILLEYLIQCGVANQSSVLGFTNSYLLLLDKVAADIVNKETLWRMWSSLASPLLEHILQTNEVNQGDSFEHDFSALISCLLFPVQKILPFDFPLQTTKALLKTWTDLYQAFARCAATVTTAEDNQCCQDLCTKICSFVINDEFTMNRPFMEVLFHLYKIMADSVDYSSYTNQNTGMQSPLVTVKWNKRKHKPLRNLSSFVRLLSHTIIAFHKHRSDQTTTFLGKTNQSYLASWTSIITNCCHTVTSLFSHISRTSFLQQLIGKLVKPLSGFYGNNNGFPPTDVYKNNILPKFDKLWQEVLMAIQARYPGPYDSETLEVFESILEATMVSPHRPIRNHTLLFWSATFAKATSLTYSDRMKICLQRLKEKNDVILPDWMDIEEESGLPVSESQSQSLLLPSSMSPSPRRIHGSFLQRSAEARQLFVSSSPFKSPLKAISLTNNNTPSTAKAKIPARRKLNIEEESTQDFVFIPPSPKKKQILTEHQKEKLQSKRVIPALYNDLEQSQDTQRFSELTSTESQLPGRMSASTAIDVTKDTTTLTAAFAALKRAEVDRSDEDVPDGETSRSDLVEIVATKTVKFADLQEKNVPSPSDEIRDDFVAKMNERIKSLKDTIQINQKEPPVEMSVTVVDESQMDDEEAKTTEDDQIGLKNAEEQSSGNSGKLDPCLAEDKEDNATVIPETLVENMSPMATEPTDITLQGASDVSPTREAPLDPMEATKKDEFETLQKTPPSGNSYPFKVSHDLDLGDIACCDNQISPHIKISTPLVKIHKLDLSNVEMYNLCRNEGQSTPVVTLSPTGSQTPQETPKFRRYKSEEIHNRSLHSGRKVRKWHSFEDTGSHSPNTESFSPTDIDVKTLFVVDTFPLDAAFEKVDVDLEGIQPLDCSFEDSESVDTQELTKCKTISGKTVKRKKSTPLRRGKRKRKAKKFSDFVTSQEEPEVIGLEEEDYTAEKRKPSDVEDEIEEKDAADKMEKQSGGAENVAEEMEDAPKKRELAREVREQTQELFSMDTVVNTRAGDEETKSEENEKVYSDEVVASQKSAEGCDAGQEEDGREVEKNGKPNGSVVEGADGKQGGVKETVERDDVSEDTPLADLKKRRRKLKRGGKKRKTDVTEVINLCDTQSQVSEEDVEVKNAGDWVAGDTGLECHAYGVKDTPDGDLAEMAKDLESHTRTKSGKATVGSLQSKNKRGKYIACTQGEEEKETNVEDAENPVIESSFVKEMLKEKVNESDKKENIAQEDRFSSEDEMPLTHLKENALSDATDEINNIDASKDSQSKMPCEESRVSVTSLMSVDIAEDGLSKKISSSRRRRRLNRSVSPKSRRNLCENFLRAKQVSTMSSSFCGFITRRRSPKRSPKLLRSMGLIGPIHTRLRSRTGNSKRISPKQKNSLKRKRAGSPNKIETHLSETSLNDCFKDLVSLDHEYESLESIALESIALETDPEEVKLNVVDVDQSSVLRKDRDAATNQGNEREVTVETNSSLEVIPPFSNVTTNSEPSTQDSEHSVDLFQNDSLGDSENEITVTDNNAATDLLLSIEQNQPEIEKVVDNNNKEKSSEDIIRSSRLTSLKSNNEGIESGSQGSTRHYGMHQPMIGDDTIATSPVMLAKFAPVLHSSPVATDNVPSSVLGSPEVLGIPGVYSPTASPSGGILKKRDDGSSNSPSPTNKNRRVKFSEKISTKEIENCTPSRSSGKRRLSGESSGSSSRMRTSSKLLPSPLVTTTPSRVVNVHSKYITTPSKAPSDKIAKTTDSSRRLVGKKVFRSPNQMHKQKFHHRLQSHTSTPPTQGNTSSQLDSSLDEDDESQESVFPQLQDCQAPVEEILPQLTSSMWSRGLGQLVRARNIFTIGQLSALTPSEVQSLPIRSPKVSHLKWVLGQYLHRLQSKNPTGANVVDQGTTTEQSQVSAEKEDREPLDLKRKLDDDNVTTDTSDSKKLKLVEELEKLSESLSDEVLRSVSPNQLFKAHRHINAMMDTIMNVLKTKYQPTSEST